MPAYDYRCDRGHVTESRQGYDVTFIPCRCGLPAARLGVYRDQYMNAETGPKLNIKQPAASRQRVRDFREASQEIDHAYSKIDDPNVKAPNYYKEGLKKARKRGAKVRA